MLTGPEIVTWDGKGCCTVDFSSWVSGGWQPGAIECAVKSSHSPPTGPLMSMRPAQGQTPRAPHPTRLSPLKIRKYVLD